MQLFVPIHFFTGFAHFVMFLNIRSTVDAFKDIFLKCKDLHEHNVNTHLTHPCSLSEPTAQKALAKINAKTESRGK